MNSFPRSWLEIDLRAVIANMRALAALASPCGLLAVVKGNAYGMGVRHISQAALESGAVARLGVASLEEALEIADIDLPKQILSAVFPEEIAEAVRHGFILPIESFSTAAAISAEAARLGLAAHCEIKIDTGMGRLGIPLAEALRIVPEIVKLPNLRITGMFTHCACAGTPGDEFTYGQIDGLRQLAASLRKLGIAFADLHCAASEAIMNYPESHQAPFTLVRPGTSIYGCCFSRNPELKLVPAVSLKGRVIAIRELPAGHSVGYSRLCRLQRPSRLAVLSAGYCDGVKIPLSNRGYALVGGKFCPIAGRVSMDYTTVLLNDDPGVRVGDEAVFIGSQGDARITVEDCARIVGTTTQDILCSLAPRVKREYLG